MAIPVDYAMFILTKHLIDSDGWIHAILVDTYFEYQPWLT